MTKHRVLVLGASGMAGHMMVRSLRQHKGYEVFGAARRDCPFVTDQLDVSDLTALRDTLVRIKPDYVVNLAGALITQCKNEPESGIWLNSCLPHHLANFGREMDFRLIQLSTDCVFSGKAGQYVEDSLRDGDDNYARSKALGEVVNDYDLTIRTSKIGPELKPDGTGLMDWLFKQEGTITGYSQAYWSGVTTLEIARAVPHFIEQNITGLYHFAPSDKISKYELLKLLAEIWERPLEINAYADYKADKSLISTRTDFEYKVPTYREMLVRLKALMDENLDLYPHYNF